MSDVNKMILLGRLGVDPTLRETKNGTPVAHFTLATTRWSRSANEEDGKSAPAEETQWHKVVVWGKQAEHCHQYLKKGRMVYLEGQLKTRKYEDKEGVTRMSFEVHAEKVKFVGGGVRREQEEEDEVQSMAAQG